MALFCIYSTNRDFLMSFRPYYLRSYYLSYSIKNDLIKTQYVKDDNSKKAKSVPVLVYHGVVSKPDSKDKYNITPETFADQMVSLKKAGYETISMKQFFEFQENKIQLPEKSFLLTFDDGRKDSYYPTDPILKALDFKATIFVIANKVNNKEKFFLNKNELTKMKNSQTWEIQPHTYDGHELIQIDKEGRQGYFYSNKKWLSNQNRLESDSEYKTRISEDFAKSKSVLKNELSVESFAFAYPYSDYGQDATNYKDAKNIIINESLKLFPVTFRQYRDGSGYSFNYPSGEYPFKRIDAVSYKNGDGLVKKIQASSEKVIPYESDDSINYLNLEWLRSWGQISFNDKKIILDSSKNGNGVLAFLDGSMSWQDYSFNAEVVWEKGSDIFLVGRYVNENNYLSLHINKEFIRIEERVDGVDHVLKEMPSNQFSAVGNYNLGLNISGSSVTGIINGQVIIGATGISKNISSGGIGFKVWDKNPDNVHIELSKVKVIKV